jgi:heme-degrading monooxygenase HmoA
MFVIVWEFRVKHDRLAEFKDAYRPAGAWAQLFRKASGFIETELLRDRDDRARFITVDKWKSRDDYDAFRAEHDAEYLAIDARTEKFTDFEGRIGVFETIEG